MPSAGVPPGAGSGAADSASPPVCVSQLVTATADNAQHLSRHNGRHIRAVNGASGLAHHDTADLTHPAPRHFWHTGHADGH